MINSDDDEGVNSKIILVKLEIGDSSRITSLFHKRQISPVNGCYLGRSALV